MIKKEVAIIGAGASGLMCAINLINRDNFNVTLFDKNDTCAKKLLITGNGRCNVTNYSDLHNFLENVPHNSKFLYSAINNFSSKDMITFLNDNDVSTIIENNNRVFPKSNKSQTIKTLFETLLNNASNICIKYNTKITKVAYENNKFEVYLTDKLFKFDIVIIATGGASYPLLGSQGDGYAFAKELGHDVTKIRSALCGIRIKDNLITGLEGSSLNIKLSYKANGKITNIVRGDVMFTSYGLSGPAVHKLSSLISDNLIFNNKIFIDFLPEEKADDLLFKIKQDSKIGNKKNVFNFLCELLNFKIIKIILNKNKIDFHKQASHLTNGEINNIVNDIKYFELVCEDFDNIERATITRGGVDVKNINSKTMESLLIKNLYFIGEVLDVDGFSGGFNLQIAFSTAKLCADAIKKGYVNLIK